MTSKTLPESIELFLFAICPFAQRVNMSLIQSQLSYEKIMLTPGEMPDGFSNISPLGNVPVLRINKSGSIFESAVINDYIAQISPVKLEPEDALQCAQMKAWSEYSNTCMDSLMQVLQAKDEETFKQANQNLINKFDVLSEQLQSSGPYFYGQQYTTIDSSYAPLFFRMKTLNDLFPAFSITGLPENIENWMQSLLVSDTLKASIIGDFPTIYRMFISKRAADGYVDKQI
ncbi:MAG: glutathione S-transferase family protein [Pseudomonadota bacterium]